MSHGNPAWEGDAQKTEASLQPPAPHGCTDISMVKPIGPYGQKAVHEIGGRDCSSARLGAQVPSACPLGAVIPLKCPAHSSGAARTSRVPCNLGSTRLTRAGHCLVLSSIPLCTPAIIWGFRELGPSRETKGQLWLPLPEAVQAGNAWP